MLEPFVVWPVVLALLALYAWLRPAAPAVEPAARPRGGAAWLLASAALVVAVRAPLAIARDWRSVDEFGYLALARFAADSPGSLFECLPNLRLHVVLFGLGEGRTFAGVDLVTSLVVGATGAILGLLVLARSGSRALAASTPLLHGLGLLPFEGLTSNAEPYAGLGLAIYLWARLGADLAPPRPAWRSLVAGAGLGLAVLFKEQAATFVLLEPLLLGLQVRSAERRALLRDLATAAAGFALALVPALAALAVAGQLGARLGWLVQFASALGGVQEAAGVADRIMPGSGPARGLPSILATGLLPLLFAPVTWLAFAGVAMACAPRDPLERGVLRPLALALLVGLATCSLGLRFFSHYFMLLLPAAAPLAALALGRLVEQAHPRRPRATLAAVVLLFTIPGLETLASTPLAMFGGAADVDLATAERMREVRARVDARAAPGERVFVGGWRPELYHALDRTPSSRCVTGASFDVATIARDLERHPPALVVLPPPVRLPVWSRVDDGLRHDTVVIDALAEDPTFRAWLDARFRLVEQVGEYSLYEARKP